jgi:hypothetical protein
MMSETRILNIYSSIATFGVQFMFGAIYFDGFVQPTYVLSKLSWFVFAISP